VDVCAIAARRFCSRPRPARSSASVRRYRDLRMMRHPFGWNPLARREALAVDDIA
jgi:hypothetical protein